MKSECPFRVCIGCADCASQMIAVLSADAVHMYLESCEKATELMIFECPVRVFIACLMMNEKRREYFSCVLRFLWVVELQYGCVEDSSP
jgi:hypothetical protein